MRKVPILIFIILFFSCNYKSEKIDAVINFANILNVSEIKDKLIAELGHSDFNIYPPHQFINFISSGYDINLIKKPLDIDFIYTFQKDDSFETFYVIDFYNKDKIYIYGKVGSGIEGFIQLSFNPYRNNQYSFLSSITIDGKNLDILSINQEFEIYNGTIIKSLPSEKSNDLFIVENNNNIIYYKSIAITSDYMWVKVLVNDIQGWVPADSLSVERGGPTINTPENVILFDLIGKNEI